MQMLEVSEQVQVLLRSARRPARLPPTMSGLPPCRFTLTEGIRPIGVSSVLGWHPAGSLERSTHCAALRLAQRTKGQRRREIRRPQ